MAHKNAFANFFTSELSAEAKNLDCPEARAMDAHPGADSPRGPHTRSVAASQGSAFQRSGINVSDSG